MSLNAYLSTWLKDAANSCVGDDAEISNGDEMSWCIAIGRTTLNLTCDASLIDICQTMSEIYNTNISHETISMVAEYLLLYAVTESGDSRFVEVIMGYEVEAQVYLKGIIEAMLTNNDEENDNDDELDNENDVEFIVEDIAVPDKGVAAAAVAPELKESHVTRVVKPVESECAVCADKDSQMKRLQLELGQTTAKFTAEIARLKEEHGVVLNKNVDMEIQIMEKESALFEKEQALRDFEAQREKFEAATQRSSKLEEQVLVLQDEVELLRPQSAELDRAEAQLLKYRAKLDELSDIREQLAVESASHTETFVKLTALEQEAEGLRRLKPQLEEYRAQHAESSIASQELQLRLAGSEALVASLREENASLRGDRSDTRQQTQHLAEELKTTAEQLRERERTNGIGEGMSELNPALMQELNRLRAENRDLSEKIDATALTALQGLEKESAEVKCINASLQKKWMSTKDALEQAQRDIQSLTFRLCEKVSEHDALRQQVQEATVMHAEDQEARRASHAQRLAVEAKRHADAMALTHTGHNTVFGIYAASLAQAHTSLESTQQAVVEITAAQEETARELASTQEDLQEAGRKRKHLEVEHEEHLTQLQGEFEGRLEETGKRHKADLSALEAQMRQEVAAEQMRTAELAAQVEQDLVRMRKLNNQKRIQEQEVARLKTQLRSAVSSDAVGEGVSEAMSELKSMEQQLKDAHAEINSLRARVAAAGENRSSTLSSTGSTAATISSLGAPARLNAADHHHPHSGTMLPAMAPAEASYGSLSYAGYLEQADLTEKRLKQLADEKRALISKNLEEVREKNEVLQKLLAMEKDYTELKCEKRKIELENRRMDARLEKLMSAAAAAGSHNNKENVVN